jgi:hypothetical protein
MWTKKSEQESPHSNCPLLNDVNVEVGGIASHLNQKQCILFDLSNE